MVERKFLAYGPRKVLLANITYLQFRNSFCYLSTILDAYTREILAYQVSDNLKAAFVLETVDELVLKYGYQLYSATIIHSDQGCHYTSIAFIEKLKDNDFVQFMSRKGNCWDNAPQESFFGHMKDDVKYKISKCSTFIEVKAEVDEWIDYYNNDRYQWDLMKLSPRQYYDYVTTEVDPLLHKRSNQGSAPSPEV